MDEAFQKALVALNNLDAPQWEKLVLKTLSSDELLGNETILASKRDRGLFLSRFATNPEGSLVKLDKLDKALKGKKFDLSLSDEFAPIDGGFFVIGANFDIDHSFSAMLSSVKDQYESEIASLLFDGRE
jgi:vacuolar-type H+-ATPase subunit E/Vma4